jgi:hypothetical protein
MSDFVYMQTNTGVSLMHFGKCRPEFKKNSQTRRWSLLRVMQTIGEFWAIDLGHSIRKSEISLSTGKSQFVPSEC